MKIILKNLFNSTLYKAVTISLFMLVPSIVFCFFPQIISIIMLAWGALLLLRDLKYKNFIKQTGSVFLLLFCIGYIVTLVLYAENDIISTIHIFCWTIIEFFLLFAVDSKEDVSTEGLLEKMYQINKLVSVVGFLSGIISLSIFLMKKSIVMPDPEGLNAFWSMGIVNGRNSGIFNNAIPCANAMFVGCVAALFNVLYKKKKSITQYVFYIVTLIICYLVILSTLTRTYIYGAYLFIFVAVFVAGYQRIDVDKEPNFKKFTKMLVLSMASVALLVCVSDLAKDVMKKALENEPIDSIILDVEGFDKVADSGTSDDTTGTPDANLTKDELEEQVTSQLGLQAGITMERNELDRLPTFLYPRDELWKVALEVIPHSPIVGFTTGNRNSTSLDYSTSDYLKNYWMEGIPTYHNAYFDITVSAGLLGLGWMLAFLLLQVIRTLRVLFVKKINISHRRNIWAYGVLVAYLATHVLVTSMFFGVLCFSNVSVCLYFWIIMGYVSRINDQFIARKSSLFDNALVEKYLKLKGKKHE